MRVTFIRLQNFRSFVDSGNIELGRLNVLIGPNNSGKSSILRGLHQLQRGLPDLFGDVRVGTTEAKIEIGLVNGSSETNWISSQSDDPFTFFMQIESKDRRNGSKFVNVRTKDQTQTGELQLPSTEPNHFIVPFLSKRKAVSYQEDIREESVYAIRPDVSFLAAKLSRLGNPAFKGHENYSNACKAILGFIVTSIPSLNGQRAGIYLPDGQTLPIDQLGEGVPNIVYFLANLAVSEGKLFIVEEPENDLHPQALKALLDLIVESSNRNQFVISTHSNIVVRHLCAAKESYLYSLRPKSDNLPVESEIKRIPNSTDDRLAVLSELGYSFSDFEFWDGWLVLEESSAERIIRDFLIPWFTPSLASLRTIASGGTSKVSSMFEELNRLFLFIHLTPTYREASWVLVDGDATGLNVIDKLRLKYANYDKNRFRAFSKKAFEYYYPFEFSDKVEIILAISPENLRREAKKDLLNEVIVWLKADKVRGKKALKESASEVISILVDIENSFKKSHK